MLLISARAKQFESGQIVRLGRSAPGSTTVRGIAKGGIPPSITRSMMPLMLLSMKPMPELVSRI